jgi:hypothetical protein
MPFGSFGDGSHYNGELKDGNCNGYGKRFYVNGDRYEGEWKRGQMHGQGKMFFADGSRYEGGWKRGRRHGKGKMFHADEDISEISEISEISKIVVSKITISGTEYLLDSNNKVYNLTTCDFVGKLEHGSVNFDAEDSDSDEDSDSEEYDGDEEDYWYDGYRVDTTSITDVMRDVDERVKKRFYKLYETQSTKETCAICLDEIEHADFEIRNCGHIFHDDCWTEYKMSKYFANNDPLEGARARLRRIRCRAICPCCRS